MYSKASFPIQLFTDIDSCFSRLPHHDTSEERVQLQPLIFYKVVSLKNVYNLHVVDYPYLTSINTAESLTIG